MRLYLNYKEFFNAIWYSAKKLKEVISGFAGVSSVNNKTGDVKTKALKFTGYSNQTFDLSADSTVKIPGAGLDNPETISFAGEISGAWNGDTFTEIKMPRPYQPVSSLNGEKGGVTLTAESVGGVEEKELPTALPSASYVRFVNGATGAYNGAGEVVVKIPRQPDNVYSVNGQSGVVTIGAGDIGAAIARQMPTALPSPKPIEFTGADNGTYDGSDELVVNVPTPPANNVTSVNNLTGAVVLDYAIVGALSDDVTELKNPKPVVFTGLVNTFYDGSTDVEINIPPESLGVTSVNGYTGAVRLSAEDIGATPAATTIKCPAALTWSGNNFGSYDGSASTFIATPYEVNLKSIGSIKNVAHYEAADSIISIPKQGLYFSQFNAKDYYTYSDVETMDYSNLIPELSNGVIIGTFNQIIIENMSVPDAGAYKQFYNGITYLIYAMGEGTATYKTRQDGKFLPITFPNGDVTMYSLEVS